MNIKIKLVLAFLIPIVSAFIIAELKGEIFAVEGINSIVLWFVPFILIFFIILSDLKKNK